MFLARHGTTAFRILNASQRNEKRFAVMALTKAGKSSKDSISDLCRAPTAEEAENIHTRLEEFNPGHQFVVINLEEGSNDSSRYV